MLRAHPLSPFSFQMGFAELEKWALAHPEPERASGKQELAERILDAFI